MKQSVFLFFIIVLLGNTFDVFAQKTEKKYNVVGLVADSVSMEPEPYATIRIYSSDDIDNAVAMLITDDKGCFSADLPYPGIYSILITSVGRKSVDMSFKVVSQKTDLGTILMTEDVNQLGEISVVAKKPLVKIDMDKIAYDVEEDPESESKTVLDMLRKVPMVSVDADGNISLVGKNSFKIYLNGKPNNMLTNNSKDVLRSMPASSVKNIEVITNPGVKYDAEGVGGVINIVTAEGKTVDGYSLNLSGSYLTNNGYAASVYGTTKVGKFSVSGNYGFTQYNSPLSSMSTVFDYFNNPDMKSVDASYDNIEYNSKLHNMALEASYEIDSLNLLSVSGSFFRVNPKNNYSGYNKAYKSENELLYGHDIDIKGDMVWGSESFAFDYQHLSGKRPGEIFVFSYRMDRTPTETDQITSIFNTVKCTPYQQHLKSSGKSLENTFQADYTIPLGKIHSFNVGAKYIYRINDSHNTEQTRGSSDSEWQYVDRTGSGYNRHLQHVFGAYSEYNLRYKRFGFKGGLRYEYTSQKVNYDNYNQPPVDVRFSDIVPSLLFSYSLGDSQNMNWGYNMRINRPGISLLNPFRDSSQSPLVLMYGNPDLKTERYHSITLGYAAFSPDFSLSLNFDYSFTNNAIMSVSFVDKDKKINYTHANVGRNHNPVMNLYLNWNPSGNTRLTLSGMYGYGFINTIDGVEDYDLKKRKNSGGQCNVYAGIQQNLPWNLNLNVYGGYGKSAVGLYTVESMDYYYYGIQLQRSFLKNEKLSISLNVNNFAPEFAVNKFINKTDDYMQTTVQKTRQFSYSVTVSYKFGNFSSAVKKAAKTILNTDVVGGGTSNKGNVQHSGKGNDFK